eukprot:COSAG05_NODE_24052_length_254_cov_0.658065_1_plen_31_part_01
MPSPLLHLLLIGFSQLHGLDPNSVAVAAAGQ